MSNLKKKKARNKIRKKEKSAMSFSVDAVNGKELEKIKKLAEILKKKKIQFEI